VVQNYLGCQNFEPYAPKKCVALTLPKKMVTDLIMGCKKDLPLTTSFTFLLVNKTLRSSVDAVKIELVI